MRFIMNFNGELTIGKNKIYSCGKVIAIFKGNKAYIGEKCNEKDWFKKRVPSSYK